MICFVLSYMKSLGPYYANIIASLVFILSKQYKYITNKVITETNWYYY